MELIKSTTNSSADISDRSREDFDFQSSMLTDAEVAIQQDDVRMEINIKRNELKDIEERIKNILVITERKIIEQKPYKTMCHEFSKRRKYKSTTRLDILRVRARELNMTKIKECEHDHE